MKKILTISIAAYNVEKYIAQTLDSLIDKELEDIEVLIIIDGSKEEGGIREYQTVIAVGSTVKCVKPGDLVVINPARYQIMKHKEGSLKDGVITDNPVMGYNFPILVIDDKPCLYLYDSDVDFVIKEYEVSEDIIEETNDVIS